MATYNYGGYSNSTYTDPRYPLAKKKPDDPQVAPKYGYGLGLSSGAASQPAQTRAAPVGLGMFAQSAPAAAPVANFSGKFAPGADQTTPQQGGQNFGLGVMGAMNYNQPGGGISNLDATKFNPQPGGKKIEFNPAWGAGMFDVGGITLPDGTVVPGGGSPPGVKIETPPTMRGDPILPQTKAAQDFGRFGMESTTPVENNWIGQNPLTGEGEKSAMDRFNALMDELGRTRGAENLDQRIAEMLGIYNENAERTQGRYADQLAVEGMRGTGNMKQGLTSMGKDLALGAAEIPEKMRQYSEGLSREDLQRALEGTSALTGQMGEMGLASTKAERDYQQARRGAGLAEELGRGEMGLREKQFAQDKEVDDYLRSISERYDPLNNIDDALRTIEQEIQKALAAGDTGLVQILLDRQASLKQQRDVHAFGKEKPGSEDTAPPAPQEGPAPIPSSGGEVADFWNSPEGIKYAQGSKEARQQLYDANRDLYNRLVGRGTIPDDANKGQEPQAGEEGYDPYK